MRKLVLAGLFIVFPIITSAQEPLARGNSQWGAWAGYSPASLSLIGTTDRKLFTLDLQYARVLATPDWGALKWTSEIVPVALVLRPAVATPSPQPAHPTFGAGVTPIGLQFNFGKRRWQPFFAMNGGLLYFTEQVPVPDSSQFNFTFSFGVGLEAFSRGNKSLLFGYRYHHISNGYTGNTNPGIDSNLLFAGFTWVRR